MKTEIMIAVLALLCIGSLAAAFVLWAKLDEQKQKTKDEHDNYIAALNLANTNAAAAQEIQERLDLTKGIAEVDLNYALRVSMLNDELQDRLSALLCPHNDHVWELSDALRCEVRCKKCGRVKDAAD